MNLTKIAWCNLRRRKSKTAFILIGLLIGVCTAVILYSAVEIITAEVNDNLEKYGANILITPKSESLSLSYGGLSMGSFSFDTQELRQSDLDNLKRIKNAANVRTVGPVVLGPVQVNGSHVLLAGVNLDAVDILKPWWAINGRLPGSEEVLAGSQAAEKLGLTLGQSIRISGRALTVSGLLASTGSQDDALLFTRLDAAQALLNKPGLISMAEVAALCTGCPIEDMVQQISEAIPGASVQAIQSVVKGRMETLNLFKKFAVGGSILMMAIAGLMVLVTMMGNVRERTREIGIFRAIGFRRGHIVRLVMTETVFLSLAAGLLGWGLGLGAVRLVWPMISQGHAHMTINPFLPLGAMLLALIVGLAASLYPALTASRQDPFLALRSL